jgi:radical SAM protein with 4Fe4S-binding SPASM domain
MNAQLLEQPVIDVRGDSAVVLFPSRPYWFSASQGVVDLFDSLNRNTDTDVLASEIAHRWSVPITEANEAVFAFIDLLYQNRVVAVDGNVCTGNQEIEPLFQVNAVENVLVVAATHECNLHCPQCYVGARKPLPKEMTTKEILSLVDMLGGMPWKNEVSRVGLTGGEFFCRTDAMDIVDYVHQMGFKVLISTNALMLDLHMIRRLANYKNLKVSVSLDGPNAQLHEQIRGEGTFEPTVAAIRNMARAGIFVGVNMFIHRDNINSIKETLELSQRLGVRAFNCLNMMRVGRANSKSTLERLERVPEHELYSILFEILRGNADFREMMKNSTFANQVMGIAGGVKSHYCGIGTNRALYVRADGNVYPCPDTALKPFLLGNIREDSLQGLWESSPILESLRTLDVDTMNNKCSACPVRYFCGGGCRGENYQVTKNLAGPHFNCDEIRRTIFEILWMLTEEPDFMRDKVANLYRVVCN